MKPENARPGDVLLGEDGSEYRALRKKENGEILAYDMHAGARVLRVSFDALESAVSRELWAEGPEPDDAPDRPEGVAEYVVDALDRQGDDELRAIAEYARRRAAYVEPAPVDEDSLEDELENEGEKVVATRDADGKGTIVEKKIPCGKDTCSQCPHGPYEYLAYREGDTVKTDYIGPA